jgi:hypothetical protein
MKSYFHRSLVWERHGGNLHARVDRPDGVTAVSLAGRIASNGQKIQPFGLKLTQPCTLKIYFRADLKYCAMFIAARV